MEIRVILTAADLHDFVELLRKELAPPVRDRRREAKIRGGKNRVRNAPRDRHGHLIALPKVAGETKQ